MVLSAINTPGTSGAVCQLDAWPYHAVCARIVERVALYSVFTTVVMHNVSVSKRRRPQVLKIRVSIASIPAIRCPTLTIAPLFARV
jgi:hypothetical protein